MESRNSSSDLFKAGLLENLRRFWPVALASFVILFFSGPYQIIASSYYESLWNNLVSNQSVGFMAVHMMVPLAAAVCVFRYLHAAGSVAVMNALPFSRARLYLINIASGVLLWAIPLVLNAFLLLFVYPLGALGALKWLGTSFLIEGFVFILAAFSACVTGTYLHSFLGAFLFNGIVPLLYLLLYAYESYFVWGAEDSDLMLRYAGLIHPFSGILVERGSFSGLEIAYYLFVIAAFFVISLILYRKRKMERAGDALAYRGFEPVLSILIAFCGMSATAYLFLEMNDETFSQFLIGALIGFIFFWIAGRMMVMKTIRVFGKKDRLNFLIAFTICAFVVFGFRYDLFRIEEYIPGTSSVESVSVSLPEFGTHNAADYYSFDNDTIRITDPENIERIQALHRSVIDNKETLGSERFYDTVTAPYDSGIRYERVTIVYDRKGPFDSERSYLLPATWLYDSPEMKAVFESEEFKSYYRFAEIERRLLSWYESNDDRTTVERSAVTVSDPCNKERTTRISPSNMLALFDAIDADWNAMTFGQACKYMQPLALVEVGYEVNERVRGYSHTRTYTFFVYPTSAKTIAFLESIGIWDKVRFSADSVSDVYVFHYDLDAVNEYYRNYYDYTDYGYDYDHVYVNEPQPTAEVTEVSPAFDLNNVMSSPVDKELLHYTSAENAAEIEALIRNGRSMSENTSIYDYAICISTDSMITDEYGKLIPDYNYIKFYLPEASH